MHSEDARNVLAFVSSLSLCVVFAKAGTGQILLFHNRLVGWNQSWRRGGRGGLSVRVLVCVFYDDAAVVLARGWENENEILSWASFQGNADSKHISTVSFKVKSSQVSDLTHLAKILQQDESAE